MDNLAQDSILAFASETEAVKWLLSEVYALRKENISQQKKMAELEAINDLRANGEAELRRRIAKLENPHKPKDARLLDELYKTMQARGLKQTDFATAARMVKRSKARMLQLKGEIGEDMRFVLVPQKNKIVIRVR